MLDIQGYKNRYAVTEDGRVWSYPKYRQHNGLYLKPNKTRPKTSEYWTVGLFDENKKAKTHLIHRLVAQTYIPNPDNKPEVNHKDGDKTNNSLSNLEWVSKPENAQHALKAGRYKIMKGEKNGYSKLKDKDIPIIRALLKNHSQSQIAKMYGVNQALISMVKCKKIWKHL